MSSQAFPSWAIGSTMALGILSFFSLTVVVGFFHWNFKGLYCSLNYWLMLMTMALCLKTVVHVFMLGGMATNDSPLNQLGCALLSSGMTTFSILEAATLAGYAADMYMLRTKGEHFAMRWFGPLAIVFFFAASGVAGYSVASAWGDRLCGGFPVAEIFVPVVFIGAAALVALACVLPVYFGDDKWRFPQYFLYVVFYIAYVLGTIIVGFVGFQTETHVLSLLTAHCESARGIVLFALVWRIEGMQHVWRKACHSGRDSHFPESKRDELDATESIISEQDSLHRQSTLSRGNYIHAYTVHVSTNSALGGTPIGPKGRNGNLASPPRAAVENAAASLSRSSLDLRKLTLSGSLGCELFHS